MLSIKDFDIYYIPIDSSNAKRTSFPFSRRSFILLPIHLKPGNVSWNAEKATLVKVRESYHYMHILPLC